eukprot:3375489-Amphidinium_carterae.1
MIQQGWWCWRERACDKEDAQVDGLASQSKCRHQADCTHKTQLVLLCFKISFFPDGLRSGSMLREREAHNFRRVLLSSVQHLHWAMLLDHISTCPFHQHFYTVEFAAFPPGQADSPTK